MSEELKPCPMCSGNAHVRERYPIDGEPRFQVQCGECYVGTTDRYQRPALAIAAWNQRAPLPDPVREVVERLERFTPLMTDNVDVTKVCDLYASPVVFAADLTAILNHIRGEAR